MSAQAPASSKISSRPRQLALALDHAESFAREDFLSGGGNAAALALIDSWPDWPSRAVALIGPEGSGKTHLATIWAAAAGARVVSGKQIGALDLPGMLATGALVIEDAGAPTDERALFHVLNLAREEQAYVLITTRLLPSAFEIELRDLRSRLRALPVVALREPDDQLFRALIIKYCADRQMAVDETVVSYLSSRIERSYAAARQAVALLDTEALRQGRPVTRALAAELLRTPPS